jgi:hypothetical protein
VYAGIATDISMTVKVKGLKKSISYWLMKHLIYAEKLKIPQLKWVREWNEGFIRILDTVYTLSATENKRILVRDSTGKIINSQPYQLVDGIKIKQEKFILCYLSALLESSNYLCLPEPKSLLSLPSNNIIYLPHPAPSVIYIYPHLPSVIYLLPPSLEFTIGLNIKFPNMCPISPGGDKIYFHS